MVLVRAIEVMGDTVPHSASETEASEHTREIRADWRADDTFGGASLLTMGTGDENAAPPGREVREFCHAPLPCVSGEGESSET